MASCKLGHVYIVPTSITKPPKSKFAICVSVGRGFFIWTNSDARHDGRDQMPLAAGCHSLIVKDCFLDLSRVVKHPDWELDRAREFECISQELRDAILAALDGLYLMPAAHVSILRQELASLY